MDQQQRQIFSAKVNFVFQLLLETISNANQSHLHFFHETTELRLDKVHLKVEGTADSSVSDDRGEDLRAVHLGLG